MIAIDDYNIACVKVFAGVNEVRHGSYPHKRVGTALTEESPDGYKPVSASRILPLAVQTLGVVIGPGLAPRPFSLVSHYLLTETKPTIKSGSISLCSQIHTESCDSFLRVSVLVFAPKWQFNLSRIMALLLAPAQETPRPVFESPA